MNIPSQKFLTPAFHSDSTKSKLREKNLGVLNPNYRGLIVATNIKTGEQLTMSGTEDIEKNGFTPSSVTRCIQGKIKQHKGFRFERKENSERDNC
jgi:hypothetical protein